MLIQLFGALEAEGMTAWQRNWFLFIVVVRLETDATFEYLIHFYYLFSTIFV